MRSIILLCTIAVFLPCSASASTEELFVDDFSGQVIDDTKWVLFNGLRGGCIVQNDAILWSHEGTTGWTGHGLTTSQSFPATGVYEIEVEWSIPTEDFCKQMGEGGTGIHFRRVDTNREEFYYQYPINSINVTPSGRIYFLSDYGAATLINTKNTIYEHQQYKDCPPGHGNDVFYYYGTNIVHVRVVLDIEAGTVKCWGNHEDETFAEATFSQLMWDEIRNGGDQFRIEEFRSWAISAAGDVGSFYMTNRLDNWRLAWQPFCTYGNEEPSFVFVRDRGKPVLEYVEWEACEGPRIMTLENDGCSSGIVFLNGEMVVSPADFWNGMVSLSVMIEVLDGVNALEVELRARPGCSVTVSIADVE